MRARSIMVALLCSALAACSTISPLKLLTGAGPNVAANTQAGKTNTQTIGQTRITEQKLVRPQARTINQSSDDNRVRAENVSSVTVNEGVAPWIWISWAALLFLDSPVRWPGQIIAGFRNVKKRKKLVPGNP
ncbi:bacteriophage spanin2 family protein [Phaeobacter gallaeciensis]|uniref:bacteriophage spanin2 family protein n=1 Tax=Phaeobacter gallaeciensis TaxID=60890 RepID=UPI0023803DC3|nr:bacteriophage spanin2 family protein [Phaeobacter gallaeciensis]MDE4297073.1 bacteriophage spanin2 family protein [Phaeobacter gallaeciensis]